MTATLTNESKQGTGDNDNLKLTSATVTAPAGFTVNSASVPACSTCTTSVSGNVVQVQNLGLAAGATQVVDLNVATPSSGYTTTSAPQSPWAVAATQGDGDNDADDGIAATLDTTTSALDTVLADLQFNTNPADAAVGALITNSPYNVNGAQVAVGAVDAAGNPVTWFTGPVTLALNPNPGNATLSGGSASGASGTGVATFGQLTVSAPGYSYALSATSPNLNPATSSPFDVANQGTAANCSSATCSGSVTQTGPTSQTTQVNSNSSAGLLTVAEDNGVSYWTSQPIHADCGYYTPLGPDTAAINLLGASAAKTITDTVTETVSTALAFKVLEATQQMCFAATTDFVSLSGNPFNHFLAVPATLPNGQAGFVGLLADCWAVNATTTPCVSSRTGTYNDKIANIEIVVSIPAAFAGDPMRSH